MKFRISVNFGSSTERGRFLTFFMSVRVILDFPETGSHVWTRTSAIWAPTIVTQTLSARTAKALTSVLVLPVIRAVASCAVTSTSACSWLSVIR